MPFTSHQELKNKDRPRGRTKPIITAAGFTLIEVLIALAVFTIGIVAAFGYAVSNQEIVRNNFDRYLAINLAREGIEIVKNARDSNWLKIDANEDCDTVVSGLQLCTWDQGLTDGYYIVDYNLRYPPYPSDADLFNDNKRLYIDSSDQNFYAHNPADNLSTNIFRMVELRTICLDTVSGAETVEPGGCNGANEQKIGIQALAQVGWQRAGRSRSIDMIDNLYNWRK